MQKSLNSTQKSPISTWLASCVRRPRWVRLKQEDAEIATESARDTEIETDTEKETETGTEKEREK